MSIYKIIEEKDFKSYQEIIENINIDLLNESNQNLLHFAISRGNIEVSHDLIRRGININAQDFKGQTPLHFAAGYNNFVIAKDLVDNGAIIDIRDNYGNTALWTAVFNGQRIKYYDVILLLVKSNANVNNVNNANKTPLDFAKQVGYDDLIQILENKK